MASPVPREIELKLEIDPGDAAPLKAKVLPKLGQVGRTERLVSVYFDTRKQVLRSNGMSVRVRTVGGKRIQTVKAATGASAGLFDRSEWETEIDGAAIDFEALSETPACRLLPKSHGALKPVFETVIDRTIWTAETKWSLIEIAVDEGEVTSGAVVQPVLELEFELKRGQPADLFSLVRKLGGAAKLRIGVRAKSERGYALSEEAPAAFKAEAVHLDPEMTTAEAFQAILHSCIRQFRLNEPMLVEGRAPEALHQARVGMRRLRSALSLFKPVVADSRFARLGVKLREVSRELGEARNLDVYLSESARPEIERDRDEPGVAAFLAEMERRRTEAYDRVVETLGSKPFRRLMIDLVEWIEVGPWLADADPIRTALRERPVSAFAAEVLDERRRKVARKGRHLDKLEPDARHRVRIEAKKLRYASEFFAGLARSHKERARHAAFIAALQDLQEHLGELNDIQTGHDIAVGFAEGAAPAAPPSLFAAAHVSGEQDAKVGGLLKAASHAQGRAAEAKRFWRKWAA